MLCMIAFQAYPVIPETDAVQTAATLMAKYAPTVEAERN